MTYRPNGKPFDVTCAEVNVSFIPKNAIIGLVRASRDSTIGNVADNARNLELMQNSAWACE